MSTHGGARATFAPPPAQETGQVDTLPEATPATPDLLCWMWAAIPPKAGRLHVARVAAALNVSDSTIRRWIKTAGERPIDPTALTTLRRRAILRGRGQFLWPSLDLATRERAWVLHQDALAGQQLITEAPNDVPVAWLTGNALKPHEVMLVYYPTARVHGVASAATPDSARKIRRNGGEILETVLAPNRYAARIIKAASLEQASEHRCIPPRSLVPTGRTETWRQAAGVVTLAARSNC